MNEETMNVCGGKYGGLHDPVYDFEHLSEWLDWARL